MSKFIDKSFLALEPYTPGEQPQDKQYIKLNTNESPYLPSERMRQAIAAEAERLHLYPDPAAKRLNEMLAQHLGLRQQQVFVGNGSDEILAFCFQALCPHGAAFADHTYGFYPVYANLYGIDAKVIPLREDFSLAVADYNSLGRTIFIANPNAPTALALSRAEIAAILRQNPENPVVVDEAYVDFGAESCAPLLQEYDNLLVVGTFSKSRSMAGARLGYAAGSEELIGDLNRIKFSFNPYNVNRMTMAAGVAALEDDAYFQNCRNEIVQTRTKTLKALREKGFFCTDSKTNFVFVTHPNHAGEMLYRRLREEGVLVRWWNLPRIQNHLRITIGSPQQMEKLLAALDHILAK